MYARNGCNSNFCPHRKPIWSGIVWIFQSCPNSTLGGQFLNIIFISRNKGVKVELGIPDELWDAPNAEIGQMTRECYTMVEDHEESIEDWYFGDQTQDLLTYLCRDTVLEGEEQGKA